MLFVRTPRLSHWKHFVNPFLRHSSTISCLPDQLHVSFPIISSTELTTGFQILQEWVLTRTDHAPIFDMPMSCAYDAYKAKYYHILDPLFYPFYTHFYPIFTLLACLTCACDARSHVRACMRIRMARPSFDLLGPHLPNLAIQVDFCESVLREHLPYISYKPPSVSHSASQ